MDSGDVHEPAATDDESSDSWDTVHVTPLTAERELAKITVSHSFVLHSLSAYCVPLQTSLHPAATAIPECLPSSVNTDAGATLTLPPYTATPGLRRPKDNVAELINDGDPAAARKTQDVFGSYHSIRVIHNLVPCAIRCATEASLPQASAVVRHTNSNTLGSASVVCSMLPTVSSSIASPTLLSASPPQRHNEQSSTSVVPPSSYSAAEFPAPQGSPLTPCPQSAFAAAAANAKDGPKPAAQGAQPATSQQLQQLASTYARSAMRRSSKVSSRRSHTSSSTLPESVVFLDPLEIIADAAITFEDIVFATHVSVRGKGPVHFVNCCFGPRNTSQLCQQFISQPLPAGTGRRRTYLKAAPSAAPMQAVEGATGTSDSSDDSGQLSGWAASAAGDSTTTADAAGSPLSPPGVSKKAQRDASQPAGLHSTNKSFAASLHLPVSGDCSSGVFGLHAGFALPTTMRVMSARRRSSLSTAAAGAPTCIDAGRGPSSSGAATVKDGAALFQTMDGFQDSAAASVLDIHGDGVCELSQCDLFGGGAGASLVCRDGSCVSVTDSSFDGPSITWAAIEVRDTATASVQFTNIQQVVGVGVLVVDRGRASVDSSVIERCGIAGVVATDNGTVELYNTSVEASASGVCVSLSGSAEANLSGCNLTTRFPLPRRASGLMFIKHLQSLGAFQTMKGGTIGSPNSAQDSVASSSDECLQQHVLNADLENLLGLWLLRIGAADMAFPTSSQSLVLSDHAVAVVAECEFTSTMRLPGSTAASATASVVNNNVDTATLAEFPSSSNSRANRSDGAVPSFTGLPPAAASAIAAVLSNSDANFSVTNSRGMSSSGHNTNAANPNGANPSHAFLLPGSSVTRRAPMALDDPVRREGVAHIARKSVTTFSDSMERLEGDEAMPLPCGLVRHLSRSSTVAVPVAADMVSTSSLPVPVCCARAPLSGSATLTASAANGPPPPPPQQQQQQQQNAAAATAAIPSSSALSLPVRRVVAGLLSSYVMAREVFGEYVGEKRRAYVAARRASATDSASASSLLADAAKRTGTSGTPDTWRASGEDRTCTELFLSFEPLSETEDEEDGDYVVKTMRLSSAGSRSTTATNPAGRRPSNLSTAAMQSLQESLISLGCLSVLMAPNGGVYHIVASRQARLALTSSVLSLALPPQLMVAVPDSWASAAGFYCGGTGAFSSTIRTTAAPFVAAVLSYYESDTSVPAKSSPSRGAAQRAGKNGTQRGTSQPQRHKEEANDFCTIFTRSNVIRYECVSMTSSPNTPDPAPRQSNKGTTATSVAAAAGGGGAPRQESRQSEVLRSTAGARCSSNTSPNLKPSHRNHPSEDEDALIEAVESSTVNSIVGAGVSGYSNSTTTARRKDTGGGEGEAGRGPAQKTGAATTTRSNSQLPPRPASASASAAQHPHLQASVEDNVNASNGNNDTTSSTAVDFNTAAWGLVLVTPPAARHSEALEAAARMQADHWCRVELSPSQVPSVVRGGASATSSTAARTASHEGPLEVPTALAKAGAQPATPSATSGYTSGSTRTVGGSTSAGRPSLSATEGTRQDSADVAERSEALPSGDGETSEMRDTQGSQVAHHLGNIFLNMANQAELLSVTHPEHICATFSMFAQVMELPAVQEYLLCPSGVSTPSPFSQAANTSTHVGAATGDPQTATIHTRSGAVASGGGGDAAAVADGGERDAPVALIKPRVEGGRAAAASSAAPATAATTASCYTSPTSGSPFAAFPSSAMTERESTRIHTNADLQRQMLLGDVDAPPLFAAATAAAAVRDAGDEASSAGNPREVTQAGASSMMWSVDRTKAGPTTFSSITSRMSIRSSPSPERRAMESAKAILTMTQLTQPTGTGETAGMERGQQVPPAAAAIDGVSYRAKSPLHTTAHSSCVASQRSRIGFPASPLGPVGVGGAGAVAQQLYHTGAIAPPSPPQLSILDVVSALSSSQSSDSSDDDDDFGDKEHGEAMDLAANCGPDSGNDGEQGYPAQPQARSKWALAMKRSSNTSSCDDAVVQGANTHDNNIQGGTKPLLMRSASDLDAGLMNIDEDGEPPASTSDSSSSDASVAKRAEEEARQEVALHERRRAAASSRPPSLFPSTGPPAPQPPTPPMETPLAQEAHHPLPNFTLSPSSPALSTPEGRQVPDNTPLGGPAKSSGSPYVSPSSSSSSTASSKPRTQSSSSYSSRQDRNDSEHRHRRRGDAHAASSSASFTRDHSSARTRSVSHHRRHPSPSPTEGPSEDKRKRTTQSKDIGSDSSASDAALAATAVATAATAASGSAPVAQEVTLERVAQLEEQLSLLQRTMLVQQARMAQIHYAFQMSASSQTENSVGENQPSLLALPPNLKSMPDGSDHTNGHSKDSRRTQSSSYQSSFSGSKIQSIATSHETTDASATEALITQTLQHLALPLPLQATSVTAAAAAAAAATALAGESGQEDGVFTETPGTSSPSLHPHPPAKLPVAPPALESAALQEERSMATAQEDARITAASSQNVSDVNAATMNATPVTNIDAHATQLPLSPLEAAPPSQPATTASAKTTPLPPVPPQTAPPQSPPLRSRARRPYSGTALEVLLAAAQHTLRSPPAAPISTAGAALGTIDDTNHAESNTSLNVQHNIGVDVPGEAKEAEEAEAEEEEVRYEQQRWEEELLRRLSAIHGVDGGQDRWRDRLPLSSSSAAGDVTGEARRLYGSGLQQQQQQQRHHQHGQRPYTTEPVEAWGAGGYADAGGARGEGDLYGDLGSHELYGGDAHNELRASRAGTSAVAYEPWRTTVATGTRHAHRPPPHPYALPAQVLSNTPSDTGTDADQLQRCRAPTLPIPLPTPPTTSVLSSRSPRARQPPRPNSCPVSAVPYAESCSSSQLSPVGPHPPLYAPPTAGAPPPPPGLYLSGRRRSIPRAAPPVPVLPLASARTSAAPPHIAHLHEDHLHDQYARAAWKAVVAQSHAQEREKRRLTPSLQSAQVQRLYTEPLQERVVRAAYYAQPTREQLYNQHGCTFTPNINRSRVTRHGSTSNQRRPSGTRTRPLRATSLSIASSRVASAPLSNNSTVISENATSSFDTQLTSLNQRRRMPHR